MFAAAGVRFTKSSNDRLAGWAAVRELLKTAADGVPYVQIFSTCTELIKCLPSLIHDDKRPGDASIQPHEVTHAPDALRYFAVYWHAPAPEREAARVQYTQDMLEDYYRASAEERAYMEKKYGGKPK